MEAFTKAWYDITLSLVLLLTFVITLGPLGWLLNILFIFFGVVD